MLGTCREWQICIKQGSKTWQQYQERGDHCRSWCGHQELEEDVLWGKAVLISHKDVFSAHSRAASIVGNCSEGILVSYNLNRQPGLCCKLALHMLLWCCFNLKQRSWAVSLCSSFSVFLGKHHYKRDNQTRKQTLRKANFMLCNTY